MRRVNYFDLGLHVGYELNDFISKIFPSLNISDYHCYGFEACKKFAQYNVERFSGFPNVNIIHKAISNKHGDKIKLYHVDKNLQPGEVGHSIFRTKHNVTDEFEEVDSVVFSKWIKEEVPSFDSDFNIMKVNIEGAEYPLFKDMVDSDILKHFPLIIGAGHDVDKVSELDSEEYWNLIEKNKIKLHRYISDWKPERNVDVASLLRFHI